VADNYEALLAGMAHAKGDAVLSMDADLQHPPALIPDMVRRLRNGAKIVTTRRIDSKENGFLKRWTAQIFYSVFSSLSSVRIEYGKADFRLLDREIVDLLLSLPEMTLFLRGMIEWIGFSQEVIDYVPNERIGGGDSRYTFRKMFGLALSGITSFSVVPLRLSFAIGILTMVLSVGCGLFVLYASLMGGTVMGWPSFVCFFSFLFGVQFVITGVLGEYLARAMAELKHRPRYIVAESVNALHVD